MSISSILNIANSGIYAARTAIQTISHNIANANTEGYARQEVLLQESKPVLTGYGYMGNGVQVKTVIRHVDQYLEKQICEANTQTGEQKTYSSYMARIELILDENKAHLGEKTQEFLAGWSDLALDPQSTGLKESLIQKGQTLSSGINATYSSLSSLRLEVNSKIEESVIEINSLTSRIAKLNDIIFGANQTGGEANDYMSQKAQLIKELSSKIDISTFDDQFGRTTVITKSGNILVENLQSWELGIDSDINGMNSIVWNDKSGNSIDITDKIGNGEIKGLITTRDEIIKSFIDDIEDYAKTIVTEVNSIHKTGYDQITGTTGTVFFKDILSDYAKNMQISELILTDSRRISPYTSADKTTDNDVAVAIAELGDARLFKGGTQTYVEFSSSLTNQVGQMKASADSMSDYYTDAVDMMSTQRESISGVSLDEEITSLMKYQYAYQAASRLFSISNQMLDELMEMVR